MKKRTTDKQQRSLTNGALFDSMIRQLHQRLATRLNRYCAGWSSYQQSIFLLCICLIVIVLSATVISTALGTHSITTPYIHIQMPVALRHATPHGIAIGDSLLVHRPKRMDSMTMVEHIYNH